MRHETDDDTAATGLCKRVRLCRHLGAFDARVLADLVRKQRARLRHYPNNVSLDAAQAMKFRGYLTAALIVLLPAAGIAYCTIRDGRLDANFKSVSLGMSPEQVVDTMGTPSWDGKCGTRPLTGRLPPDCVREFGYADTLAPLTPEYWLIWFGSNERVIHTAKLVSP
jgi:putative hemolysin